MLTHEITRTYGIFPRQPEEPVVQKKRPAGEPVPQFMFRPQNDTEVFVKCELAGPWARQ